MSENNQNLNDEAQLRLENEMKKLNLELEGAVFGYISDDVPLDLEKQFLDNIMAFETQSKNAKYMLLYKFLGEPHFLPFAVLPDEQVETELKRLTEIMENNGVYLDFLCDYPIETMYRFITEEFMNHEVSDMRIPGMMNGFIYEEFHPNHEHDLRNDTENFFHSIMNLESNSKSYFLSQRMEIPNKALVDKVAYERRIDLFRDQFNTLQINQLVIQNLKINNLDETNKSAIVDFDLDYEGTTKTNHRKVEIRDKGRLNFLYSEGYWTISCIVFKGF